MLLFGKALFSILKERRKISVTGSYTIHRFTWHSYSITLGLVVVSLILSSCGTTIPEPRYVTPTVKKTSPPAPAAKQLVPEGWADITSRSKQPQIKLWLVNRDYSATMVLRELYVDSATQKILQKEAMNLIATISLRAKVPESDPDYRVTRVPEMVDVKRNFASYAYSEKGLLRRVLLLKKQNRILEIELMQEQQNAEFDPLTEDLFLFAKKIYER